jgi:pilus assembly protein Flp/PilA
MQERAYRPLAKHASLPLNSSGLERVVDSAYAARTETLTPAGEVIMQTLWQAFWSEESGQGLVEYALIIALVAIGLMVILLVLRNSIGNVFNNAATQINNAPTNPYP